MPPTQEQTAAKLHAITGMPMAVAAQKAASLGRGIVLLLVGVLLMFAAAALVGVPIVLLEEMPGALFLVFAGLFGAGGLLLALAGAHVMSGEAVTAAAQTGSVFAKTVAAAIAKARGKTPS